MCAASPVVLRSEITSELVRDGIVLVTRATGPYNAKCPSSVVIVVIDGSRVDDDDIDDAVSVDLEGTLSYQTFHCDNSTESYLFPYCTEIPLLDTDSTILELTFTPEDCPPSSETSENAEIWRYTTFEIYYTDHTRNTIPTTAVDLSTSHSSAHHSQNTISEDDYVDEGMEEVIYDQFGFMTKYRSYKVEEKRVCISIESEDQNKFRDTDATRDFQGVYIDVLYMTAGEWSAIEEFRENRHRVLQEARYHGCLARNIDEILSAELIKLETCVKRVLMWTTVKNVVRGSVSFVCILSSVVLGGAVVAGCLW